MAKGINKVIVLGNIGHKDVKQTQSGATIVRLSVATSEKWKDKSTQEEKKVTEWHRIVFFGKLAEIAAKYLEVGSQVYVEGQLRTQKYTDKDGVDKYATDIIARDMQMLGKSEGAAKSPTPPVDAYDDVNPHVGNKDYDMDDIPF